MSSVESIGLSASLENLVKKILLAFCEVHVSFGQRLDIYGSIHLRTDDCDLVSFVLNEHSYKRLDPGTDSNQLGTAGAVGLTRYISSVKEVSPVETFRHNVPRSNANCSDDSGESCATKSGPDDTDNRNDSKRTLNAPGRRVGTPTGVQHVKRGPSREGLDDEGGGDVQRYATEEPHGVQGFPDETETWEETNFEMGNGTVVPDEQMTSCSYIKQEREHDDSTVVKTEAVNENDVIDIASDDETYEQSEEYAYNSLAYDNSGLYPGYALPSVPNSQSETYSQSEWRQNAIGGSATSVAKPLTHRMCQFCLKSFTSSIQLRLHIQRYHSAPESSTNWQRQRIASGSAVSNSVSSDKKLTCSICMLSFKSLDGLRCHENSKHSRNKVYNCQFCAQFFLTRQAAYTHRIKFHRLKVRKPDNSA